MDEKLWFMLLVGSYFCHIIDDFYLQGILANLKQREWWEKNAPDALYALDYIVALIVHGFSWATMMLLPFAAWIIASKAYSYTWLFAAALATNAAVHAFVDDLKCNKRKINLITDQYIHFLQIFITWFCVLLIVCH